jgi:hypothetical protein
MHTVDKKENTVLLVYLERFWLGLKTNRTCCVMVIKKSIRLLSLLVCVLATTIDDVSY